MCFLDHPGRGQLCQFVSHLNPAVLALRACVERRGALAICLHQRAASMNSPAQPRAPIVNAMTVDVEDYFHVSAFENTVSRSQWETLDSRVSRNTERLLALFDQT